MNKYVPHILVLPEDKANAELALGFISQLVPYDRTVQLLPLANGWTKVRDDLAQIHSREMMSHPDRYIVLLVDYDKKVNRQQELLDVVPDDLKDRVFVLGAWKDPEDLVRKMKMSKETIGSELAADCRTGSTTTWNHPLLKHNAGELKRMTPVLRPILFPVATD